MRKMYFLLQLFVAALLLMGSTGASAQDLIEGYKRVLYADDIEEGKTYFIISDRTKDDSAEAVAQLGMMGVKKTVMLTGDRNDVAAVTFVTPNYLSKLFKNSMNMNLREYINQLRIEEAKRLLLSTSLSVSEIASNVGYYNISYFSTVFHKIVGVSPYDWRNQKGEDDEADR